MENNQSTAANGSPVTGKPVSEGAGSEKLNRNAVGVFDHFLNTLNDHVLNAESAVRENTAQLRVMASSVELVRQIPDKMEAAEQQLVGMEQRVEQCIVAFNTLWERVDNFEKSAFRKLETRMDGLEQAMGQLARQPAVCAAEMDDLRNELRQHAELFEKPQIKTVHHRHYLSWYIWIIIGFFVVSVGMGLLWQDSAKDATRHAGNDLLWRGAWQIQDSVMHKKLFQLKTQYDTSSEWFRRQVLEDEAQDEELTQKLKEENIKRWQANEAQQEAKQAQDEADELKKQRKKH